MNAKPLHVYCQQIVAPREWCQRRAVARDPRNPAHSSLCARHLAEIEAALTGASDA